MSLLTGTIAKIMASMRQLEARQSLADQLDQPTSNNAFGNRKGGRKQAHRFSGVAAQRRAAKKLRNSRK